MPIKIQRANERGSADYGWLRTNYSFSFGNYYNPKRMGFGALRVLNDDIIAPGRVLQPGKGKRDFCFRH